jgi:hypothetical protein
MAKHTDHPRIAREFKDILPPLSESEFHNLEKDVLKRGILHPIFVWNGICIDGMHRLKIAKKHKLNYQVKELHFKNKEEARVWVFEHQVARRNQSPFTKIVAGLSFENYYKAKAKENQRQSPGRGKKGSPIVGKPIDTLRLIAQRIGISHSYVSNVKLILKHGNKDLIQQCHNGEISIRNAYYTAKNQRENKKNTTVGSEKSSSYINPDKGQYINQIIQGDCLEVMPEMIKDGLKEKISCIIASPPYNCNKNYGKNHNDDIPYDDYLKWLGKVIRTSAHLLRPGGRLIWVVAEVANRRKETDDDSYYHTIYPDLVHMVRNNENALKLRGSIVWNKKTTKVANTAFGSYKSPASPVLRSNHEHIIIWSKDQWNLPNITGEKPDM